MRCVEKIKDFAIKLGVAMAKIDSNTTCPWIYYQPSAPEALVRLREEKEKTEGGK